MEVLHAINERKSIRRYSEQAISKETIEEIVNAGIRAPSSKNRQPWRFVIVNSDSSKLEMLDAMRSGLKREETAKPALPDSKQFIPGAKHTLRIMEQAPVTIFVINPLVFRDLS